MQTINGTLIFERQPRIASFASVVGKKEGEGPLRAGFDSVVEDSYFGQDTFEKAETEMLRIASQTALQKGGYSPDEIGIAFGGDLLNQCVASGFAFNGTGIPYAGIYGACSTMALGLLLSAVFVDSGAAARALCAASSHFCTAERQYRTPLEYGSQRPPTAQWTVTGAGACVIESPSVSKEKRPGSTGSQTADHSLQDAAPSPYISAACPGIITDFAVTDQSNMGAAMAPAVVKLGTKIKPKQRFEQANIQ